MARALEVSGITQQHLQLPHLLLATPLAPRAMLKRHCLHHIMKQTPFILMGVVVCFPAGGHCPPERH